MPDDLQVKVAAFTHSVVVEFFLSEVEIYENQMVPDHENMVDGTVVRSRTHGLSPWQRGRCGLTHCRGKAAQNL